MLVLQSVRDEGKGDGKGESKPRNKRRYDEATRDKHYKDFQQLVYEEQPIIFLFSPQERLVVHQRFESVVSRLGLSLQHLKLKK